MTITELKQLRKKLTVDPIGNKAELLWIRGKIKSLQTIASNKRIAALPRKLTPDDMWAKAFKEGRL